jgi:hypothetical protein
MAFIQIGSRWNARLNDGSEKSKTLLNKRTNVSIRYQES